MTAQSPSQFVHPDSRDGVKRPAALMRTDLNSMMLPLFTEDSRLDQFSADIEGVRIKIHSKEDGVSIAGATDRKLLNILAGYLASMIRGGGPVTRHISIDVAGLMKDIFGDTVSGGADYARLTERLKRLQTTVIETETDLPNGDVRHKLFSWLDTVQYDDRETPGGRRLLSINISFNQDAFHWITRAAGIDMPPSSYHVAGASRTSSWRIYEICLARLISSGRNYAFISLCDLRDRIPITSELKVFKARSLKMAMAAIECSDEMSGHLKLHLARREDGKLRKVSFSDRGSLSDIVVVISKGENPLPKSTPLVSSNAEMEDHEM